MNWKEEKNMRIINKIHQNGEWIEYNPDFKDENKFSLIDSLKTGDGEKLKVDIFKDEKGRLVIRKEHDELNYTTGQSKKGIRPPTEYKVSEYGYRKVHYHYYFCESVKLGTYTCNQCQGVKKDQLKCCKEPTDGFFEHRYDGGSCHACYDTQTELLCAKCYIKKNLFRHDCWLEDDGDYVVKN